MFRVPNFFHCRGVDRFHLQFNEVLLLQLKQQYSFLIVHTHTYCLWHNHIHLPTKDLTAIDNQPLGHPMSRPVPILMSSQNRPLDVDLVQSVSRLPSPVPDTTARIRLGIPSPTTATKDLQTRPILDILFNCHSSQTPSLILLGRSPLPLQQSPRLSASLAYFDPCPAAAFV